MFIVGQKENIGLIDDGKLDNANFIIIKGPRNYGKTYLTKYIANHYNMNYVLLDNKVDTIRNLVQYSDKNNNCCYHFKDFEKSSPAAKAALLKIAEETPKGIKIVITTSSYNILQTLISRAYVLNIEPYSNEDIEEYNNKLDLDNNLFDIINNQLKINITPSKLFKYKNTEEIEKIVEVAKTCSMSINNGLKLEDISVISNNFWKQDPENMSTFLELIKGGIDKNLRGYYKIISSIEKTNYLLRNVSISNYKQLIHNMLMEMV